MKKLIGVKELESFDEHFIQLCRDWNYGMDFSPEEYEKWRPIITEIIILRMHVHCLVKRVNRSD
jgi:hypothetical protein